MVFVMKIAQYSMMIMVITRMKEEKPIKKKKHFHSSRIESEDEEESSAKLNPSSIANGLATIVAASAEQFLCGEPDEDLTRSQKSIMYMNQDHTPLQNENKEGKIKDGNEMEIDDTIKHFVVSVH
ncbi:hypothetical protein M9Y10_018617 [Tritrichomonas musculus]|uniref:Uncharacterized protein n=1 Tax=Tritrichomonas musculus TaxID=1915356 RepID=A0ABR2HM80_9EUKA